MRVWLDDWRSMPQGFDTLARDADEAIAILKTKCVTAISLDYELGRAKTGIDVALFIAEQAERGELPRLEWSVHSSDPRACDRMREILARAEVHWSQRHGFPLQEPQD